MFSLDSSMLLSHSPFSTFPISSAALSMRRVRADFWPAMVMAAVGGRERREDAGGQGGDNGECELMAMKLAMDALG